MDKKDIINYLIEEQIRLNPEEWTQPSKNTYAYALRRGKMSVSLYLGRNIDIKVVVFNYQPTILSHERISYDDITVDNIDTLIDKLFYRADAVNEFLEKILVA